MDSFADIFFLFTAAEKWLKGMVKIGGGREKNEWSASGWIIRKEIGARMVKK